MSDEQKQDGSIWRRFSPPKDFYTSTQCMTRIVYVNKDQLHDLFDMIEDEPDWHRLNNEGSRPSLFNYIDHTFRRCVDMGAVAEATVPTKGSFLVFCTGLYTKTHDLLYCVCGPNRYPKPETPTRIYSIIAFPTTFSVTGKFLTRFGLQPLPMDCLPAKPVYCHPLPQFDPTLPLPEARINVMHLLREGHIDERFPCSWRHQYTVARRGNQVGAFFRVLRDRLMVAIKTARELANKHPELVVLHYCRSRQEIQYLLPINLTQPQHCFDEPDCVVTLRLVTLPDRKGLDHNMYEVNTILPVDIARGNARLLQRPTQAWIHASKDNFPLTAFKKRR